MTEKNSQTTKDYPDWWPETCEWPLVPGCKRPATVMGGGDTPSCAGHAMLGRWNSDTHSYPHITDPERKKKFLYEMKDERDKIVKWFKDNPEPS
jgi:hypothetical protein